MGLNFSRRTLLTGAAAGVASAALVGITTTGAEAASYRVFLDPGHGGSDSGATAGGIYEKDFTLRVAQLTRDYINYFWPAIAVGMTHDGLGSRDDLGLYTRAYAANRWGANAFVSIHCNSHYTSTANGFETFRYSGPVSINTTRLQSLLHSNVRNRMNESGDSVRDRGMQRANYVVLRETSMPAVLTESAFITNPRERAMLARDDFRHRVAQGHAQAIAEYFRLA